MKKFFAILAVLVLFGTYAWAGDATQTVNVTVTCSDQLVVTCQSSPWEPSVAAGASATSTFTWNITGDGTNNPVLVLGYNKVFPWDDGNGVILDLNDPVQGDWRYEGCNDNVSVTAEATVTVDLHATSGVHTFAFDLTATY